jgi:hypothetical protein
MSQPIRLTLQQVSDTEAIVILDSAQGQADHHFTLPWLDSQEWSAIFLYLEAFRQDSKTWPGDPGTIKLASELGLAAEDGTPLSHRIERIGSKLYQSVLGDGECARCFQRTLDDRTGEPSVVELHFPDAGSYLQTYPWEVLHDSGDFLFDSRRASLVRYVDFDKPLRPFRPSDELNVLLVDPRPQNSELPVFDRAILEAMLPEMGERFHLRELVPIRVSTFGRLSLTLTKFLRKIPVIHIDSHGGYGLLCEGCGNLSLHGDEACPHCGWTFSAEQKAQGHIAFESDNGGLKWVSGEQLGKALLNQGVQLVVLSACRSGLVGGRSVFNSVAGALVRCGIPAVVAMQFSVETESTKAFVASLYYELSNGATVAHAMATARTVLQDYKDAWYRPVLYLRTHPENMEGGVLVSSLQEMVTTIRSAPEETKGMDPDLVAKLEEWKRVHSGSQALYHDLGMPISILEAYRGTPSPELLKKVGDMWQESYVDELKSIPAKWDLRHARDPILDQLSAQTSSLDDLTMLLRIPNIQGSEFESLYDRFLRLRGIIWKTLTVADRNIEMLIGHLKTYDRRMIV